MEEVDEEADTGAVAGLVLVVGLVGTAAERPGGWRV